MSGRRANEKTSQLSDHVGRRIERLLWRDGDGKKEIIVERRMTIGAAEHADVRVADPAVSRLHAELDPRPDGLWVRDLGSRNGTFLGAVRVREARLEGAEVLRVGKTELRLGKHKDAEVALWPSDRFGKMIGKSEPMRELFASIAKIARTDLTTLIHGESGTGKELVAQALHETSPRARAPFIVLDCAALPENLLEAELFGHARGAFTGAATDRPGAVEEADGGTLFLDEIGELPLSMQPKLLRMLETKTIRRVGENRYREVDIRFIAATHRDLRELVNQGAFREDLLFRLAVVRLEVPALRERREDIPLLLRAFLPDLPEADLAPLAAEAAALPWLGNVRELGTYAARVSVLGREEALALQQSEGGLNPKGPSLDDVPVDQPYKSSRDALVDRFERAYFGKLLAAHENNISAVARTAGVNRTWLHEVLRRHRSS